MRRGTGERRRTAVRAIAGAVVRRLLREAQWRAFGVRYARRRETDGSFRSEIAAHASPLYRDLVGMPDELQRNKVVNLRLAAARLDGVVVLPGERLSFWRLVGKPSRRRGFVDGAVLSHGRVVPGVGGGLCQITNLLYWLTLHTPLTVVERWRHSYDVFPDADRTQPFGSGATCAFPALDLQIENRTLVPFVLRIVVAHGRLHGSWWSTGPLGAATRSARSITGSRMKDPAAT